MQSIWPIRLLFLGAAAALLLALAFAPGLVRGPDAQAVLARTGFDASRALATIERIAPTPVPAPVDSPEGDARRVRLLAEITALGYEPVVREDFVCRGAVRWNGASCGLVRNVLFEAGPPGPATVMIAAHYDSVGAGPGIADDLAGVAAMLEIARGLQTRPPAQRVLFAITDGEETGLLGAQSFVRTDPLAAAVKSCVNLEARGTTGPAIMFQTSHPNAGDVTGLARQGLPVVANSLAADIYRLLPNDTDATVFLEHGCQLNNMAFIQSMPRYHTPRDSLEYLSRDSLAHIGATARASLDGFAGQPVPDAAAGEGKVIYADVLGRWMLVLPQLAGLLLPLVAAAGAAVMLARSGPGGLVRALVAPLLAVLIGGGLAFGLQAALGAIRPEDAPWTAQPMPLRLALAAAALAGAAGALWLAGQTVKPGRVAGAGWLWLSGLFAGLYFVVPGATILLAPAAGVAALSALIGLVWPVVWRIGAVLASVMAAVFIVPAVGFAEDGLTLAMGWAFAALAALLAFVMLAPLRPSARASGAVAGALAAVAVAAFGWALVVPAYSTAMPRHLTLQHWQPADTAIQARAGSGPGAWWVASTDDGPLPAPLEALGPFSMTELPGLADPRRATPAPRQPLPEGQAAPQVTVLSSSETAGIRRLELEVRSGGARRTTVIIPKEAGLVRFDGGGAQTVFEEPGRRRLTCSGRACASWRFAVELSGPPQAWEVRSAWPGLGPAGEPLVAARPDDAVPAHDGDMRIVWINPVL